jgi:lipopolysaccharide biosynthesis protein
MHYPDLAEDFVRRLTLAACPIDLLVTTTDPQKRRLLEEVFASYGQGTVTYLEVPNRGRDIGPFLTHIGSAIDERQYDVVGHLHAKRSAAVDSTMGDRWRHYLLQTLLGERLAQLLDLFQQDERLGLVFPEDRHVVGWDKNYEVAQQLAERIEPRPALPAFPYFPLGTMFWARRAALKPLWNAGFKTEDFPREPVPYDGTILHALERILPSCIEATGYSWCTVYEPDVAW